MDTPTVTAETTRHAGRFVVFKELTWTDATGRTGVWETADRANDHGAVLIITRLMPSDRMALIRQYRPPGRRLVYEFPAGLIDAGETAETAAARELREETGYTAARLKVFPSAYTSPGLSSESVFMVMAEVDETAVENETLHTDFDETEMIETVLIPRAELAAFYQRESAAGGAFDAKLAAYICGCGLQ